MKIHLIGIMLLTVSLYSYASDDNRKRSLHANCKVGEKRILDEISLYAHTASRLEEPEGFTGTFFIEPDELDKRTIGTKFAYKTTNEFIFEPIVDSLRLICTSQNIENCQSFRFVQINSPYPGRTLKEFDVIHHRSGDTALSEYDAQDVFSDLQSRIVERSNAFNPKDSEELSEYTYDGVGGPLFCGLYMNPLCILTAVVTIPLGILSDVVMYPFKLAANNENNSEGIKKSGKIAKNIAEYELTISLGINDYRAIRKLLTESVREVVGSY